MAASSSSASPATAVFSFEHFLSSSPSEQLCCVRCNLCATVLVVSVPCSSLLMTVRVRCGQCTNLFAVNMKGLLLSQANQFQASQRSLLLDEIPRPPSSLLVDLTTTANNNKKNTNSSNNNNTVNAGSGSVVKLPFNGGMEDVNQLGRMPAVSRPPEKRQRIPSAYNRFIKDEIQRIKAGNPDITHREAFSAAAKNWAHFPHIHFGLMPDQVVRTTGLQQQEEDSLLLKEFYKGTATDMGGSVTCNF